MLDTIQTNAPSESVTTERMHARWRGHAVTGALLMFFFSLLLLFLSVLFGTAHSPLLIALLKNVSWSVLVGAPLGYAISRAGGGVGRGAAIGAGAFLTIAVVASLPGGLTALSITPLTITAASGMVFGAFLGWHVEQDR